MKRPESGEDTMEYLDFELEIDLATGHEYPVSVVRSPAGEARATMIFPYDTLALRSHLQALELALLRSSGKSASFRGTSQPEGPAVSDFGKTLFNALLPAEIRGRYVVSREKAASHGKGLRLKLRVRPPELAALPWEFLYDPDEEDYICLSRSTPIVRYLEMPQSTEAITIVAPLRVLGMVASPADLPNLDSTRERQRVEEALKQLIADGRVELTWLEGQTWRHLREAMWSGPWHVFHFVGHGEFDANEKTGLLIFADDNGRSHRLTANQVARLLNDHESLRLVLLNSCDGARAGDADVFSSSAATLVRRGIPAVVAMQYEITDAAAIEFARTFYRATAFGMPVDAAVAEARSAILIGLNNSLEWGTPVLYMRSGDGLLFDFRTAPVSPRAPTEQIPPVPTPNKPREASYDTESSSRVLDDPDTRAVPTPLVGTAPAHPGSPERRETPGAPSRERDTPIRNTPAGQGLDETIASHPGGGRDGGRGKPPRRFGIGGVALGAVALIGIFGGAVGLAALLQDEETDSRDADYVATVCDGLLDLSDAVAEIAEAADDDGDWYAALAEAIASHADTLDHASPPSDFQEANDVAVSNLRAIADRFAEHDETAFDDIEEDGEWDADPDVSARLQAVAEQTDSCIELSESGYGDIF